MSWAISHKYRFIFIHVPKTGGTSLHSERPGSLLHAIVRETGTTGAGHKTASQLRNRFRDEWGRYTKFAFVRHPIARFKSGYFFNNSLRRKEVPMSPAGVLRELGASKYLQPLVHWVDCDVDYIGRYERYEQDVRRILGAVGVPLPRELPHFRKTNSADIRLGDDLERAVRGFYASDFARFGYDL